MKKEKLFALVLLIVGCLLIGLVFAGANNKTASPGNLPDEQAAQTLKANHWEWQSTYTTGGETVTPNQADSFVLSFLEESRFSSTTDCNNLMGSYTLSGDNLSFGQIASTMMYCEGSQESFYSAMLSDVEKFYISENELTLHTKSGETSVFSLHEAHD